MDYNARLFLVALRIAPAFQAFVDVLPCVVYRDYMKLGDISDIH
jgi:hypothetical protein